MPTPITLKVFRGNELVRTEHFTREIINMGSAEGTFVNGKKVSRGALKLGDQITLGGLRIVVDALQAAPAAPGQNEAHNVAVSIPAQAAPAAAPALPAGPKKPNGTNGATAARTATVAAPAPVADAVPEAAKGGPVPAPAPERSAARARPRLRPASRETEDLSAESDLGVELRLLWGETLIDAATWVKPKKPVLVGETPNCDAARGAPGPGVPRAALRAR